MTTPPFVNEATDLTENAEDPLLASADPVETAREHIATHAFAECPGGRVGLELELHLVDLDQPGQRPAWSHVRSVASRLPTMPSGSAVTFEPGGQIELSTPPAEDLTAAVDALRSDRATLRHGLAEQGFGAAPLGADPAREVARINPGERYRAMERHFTALGCGSAGTAMMTSTAALQVNLDAGPAAGWRERMDLVHTLLPVLTAASAGSPLLGGRSSGWQSMRQETWHGIDPRRAGPVRKGDPAEAWAAYALHAPVMMVRAPRGLEPITEDVSFEAWLRGDGPLDRRPTLADLDQHLTTLFPPVRPRGYLELRCLDALPDRWWPALTAFVVTLVDDPHVASEARALCEPVTTRPEEAARAGLTDPVLRRALTGCLDLVLRRTPEALRVELEDFAELFERGSSPSEELRAAATASGPLRLLEEEARA